MGEQQGEAMALLHTKPAFLRLAETPRPQLQELSDKHKQALRLLFMGASVKEAAEDTGFSTTTISAIKKSDIGQQRLEQMHEQLDDEAVDTVRTLQSLVPLAIEAYHGVLANAVVHKTCDVLKAADAVCDRAGLPRQSSTTVQGNIQHTHVTAAELVSLKKRALDAARAAGLLVDVTLTDTQEVQSA